MTNEQTTLTPDSQLPDTQAAPEKKSRKKRWALLALLLLLLLGLGTCAAVNFMNTGEDVPDSTVALMPDIDGNAEDITDREGLTNEMQGVADASYFTLQVNPEASFSSETGSGTFELINPSSNVYPISFEIVLDESGQVVYQSGAVMPNKQISNITLDEKLTPGSYQATVKVLIYNQDTQEKEGETQVKLNLNVS